MPNYTKQDLKDNLDYLEETKKQIKQAIINKGVEVSNNDTFRSYVDKINSIEVKGETQTKTITITENNTTVTVTPDSGYDGISEIVINVDIGGD